jgi:hypothetical protein
MPVLPVIESAAEDAMRHEYRPAASGAKWSVAYRDLECPLLGVERKSDFEGDRSVDDPGCVKTPPML